MRRYQKCYVVLDQPTPKLVQATYFDKTSFQVGHISYHQGGCRKRAYDAWLAYFRINEAKIKKIQRQQEKLERQKKRLDKQAETAIKNMQEIVLRKSYGNP